MNNTTNNNNNQIVQRIWEYFIFIFVCLCVCVIHARIGNFWKKYKINTNMICFVMKIPNNWYSFVQSILFFSFFCCFHAFEFPFKSKINDEKLNILFCSENLWTWLFFFQFDLFLLIHLIKYLNVTRYNLFACLFWIKIENLKKMAKENIQINKSKIFFLFSDSIFRLN